MLAPRVPAQPQASLCLPTSLALPTCYFAALIARANRVCPTLGVSFSCLHALMPFVSTRHSVALPCAPYTTFPSSIPVCATLSDPHKLLPWPSLFWPFQFPTCLRDVCLPDAWLAFVFLQAWQSPRANLQPAARVPIVSARRLVRLSLAFPASLCHLYPPNVLFVSPNFTLALRSPRAATTRAYGLLALSSAPFLYSLHRLVSQSTRNMIDWLRFLFPCAFLYTTDSPVACGVRVCKLLPYCNFSLPFPFATCLRHACLLNPRPAFVFLQALHSPHATLQPSSRVPIVSVRRLARLSLAFTRLCHSCLPDTRLLFVLDSPPWPPQGVRLCPACAGASSNHVCSARYLQPPPYVPRRSARHLLCPSLAVPTSFCHLCLRKVSCALPQHAISPSLPLASMCAVYKIPSRTHTEPAPQCRTWPSTLAG